MRIIEKKLVETDVTTDILCDCCGKSCNSDYGFNAMKLEHYWGFSSKKDLEHWEAYLCEQCVDEKLSFIKFKVSPYRPF